MIEAFTCSIYVIGVLIAEIGKDLAGKNIDEALGFELYEQMVVMCKRSVEEAMDEEGITGDETLEDLKVLLAKALQGQEVRIFIENIRQIIQNPPN